MMAIRMEESFYILFLSWSSVLFILLGVRRAISKQKLLHKSILRCDCLQLAGLCLSSS
jgi:hypothetical protein